MRFCRLRDPVGTLPDTHPFIPQGGEARKRPFRGPVGIWNDRYSFLASHHQRGYGHRDLTCGGDSSTVS